MAMPLASNSMNGTTAATATRTADGAANSSGQENTSFSAPENADAMFVWRKFIDDTIPKQEGVNCAVFRNEAPSRFLSSELVRQADAVADFCWPGERHYTYVNLKAVRSRNPGFCFVAAGWRRCGTTRGGLLIFERCR